MNQLDVWSSELGISYPIIQAGMAGGPTTPNLVSTVSEAGGLGTLGAGYMSPKQIKDTILQIRQMTQRPFAVNLLIPGEYALDKTQIARMNERLNVYRTALGLPPSPSVQSYSAQFSEQVDVLLESHVDVFSFTFGVPPREILQQFHAQGTYVIGTATNVREAVYLQEQGVDAIVAQGSEAGGHRGSFLGGESVPLIGTMALVPQMVDAVSIPVIASGGMMDGRGLAAALALGAIAVQMGTAFLTCPESGAHHLHKEAILQHTEEDTNITTAYSGKPARGIQTKLMDDFAGRNEDIPPYPVQNALTRDIRQAAAKQHQPEYMSLWAGQGLRLSTSKSAAQIVRDTVQDARKLLQKLSSHSLQ